MTRTEAEAWAERVLERIFGIEPAHVITRRRLWLYALLFTVIDVVLHAFTFTDRNHWEQTYGVFVFLVAMSWAFHSKRPREIDAWLKSIDDVRAEALLVDGVRRMLSGRINSRLLAEYLRLAVSMGYLAGVRSATTRQHFHDDLVALQNETRALVELGMKTEKPS